MELNSWLKIDPKNVYVNSVWNFTISLRKSVVCISQVLSRIYDRPQPYIVPPASIPSQTRIDDTTD